MLKHDLSYHPYKLQIVEELEETDSARWKHFCEQFLHLQLQEDTEFFLATSHTCQIESGCEQTKHAVLVG